MSNLRATAEARRDGKKWRVTVQDSGVILKLRRLDLAVARVASACGVPKHRVELKVLLDAETDASVERVRQAREVAAEATRVAVEGTKEVVGVLREKGFTVRDIAVMLGIAPQRVAQIDAELAEDDQP